MLNGYKTYITGVVAIITAVGAYLSGDVTVQQLATLVVQAVLAVTIRHGISTDAKK